MKSDQSQFDQLTPLFILGIARTGTTLLQSLLDGHPQLLVDVADSHFFVWYKYYFRWIDAWWRRSDTMENRINKAESVMVSYIFNEPSRYYQDFLSWISIPELKNNFRKFIRASEGQPKHYLESYFHALGAASGHLTSQTCFWVDKTLSHEYLFYRYKQWWPNARFIFMVRDPRDVYASYKKRDIKNNRKITQIESFAVTWSNSIQTLHRGKKLVNKDRWYFLNYEDLIYHPEDTMNSIAEFLQIKFHPGMLLPTKGFGRVPWGGNAETGKKPVGIFTSASQKWKKILSNAEVSKIENLLYKEMQITGYSLTTSRKIYIPDTIKKEARRRFFQMINFGL